MPILKRDDGVQFAIHTYRELLSPAKTSLLKSEIRMLAQNHGEYVRLFKLPTGQTEAVFSRDPGYLLGETVWQYFNKPANLIYCEMLADNHYAILVVVRSGSVYLDTKIPLMNVADELSSLVTGKDQYEVYVYGDVPVSETKQRGKFTFDKSQVINFTRLDRPIFNYLPVDNNLQLQPLEFALRSLKSIRRIPGMGVLFFVFILFILGWWYHQSRQKPPKIIKPSVISPAEQKDPYQAYRSQLITPSPTKQMSELAAVIGLAYRVPGWQVTGVTFDGSDYTIQLNPAGGTLTFLSQWAKARQLDLVVEAQGVTLTLPSKISYRASPTTIYNAQQVAFALIDKIDRVLPEKGVTMGNITSFPFYKTMVLGIQFSGAAPDILILLGRQFVNLPVNLNNAQITVDSSGLLTGNIQITVVGN